MKQQSSLHSVITASRIGFLLVAAMFAITTPARAVIVINWQQTGSDVTATLTGTIDAAWGSEGLAGSGGNAGGYDDAFGGFGFGYVRVGYGEYTNQFGFYSLSGISFSAPLNITGTQLTGGLVQPGYTPDYGMIDISSSDVGLAITPGATSFNTSIVWTNKQLSDFFTSGVPVLTDIYNSSNQKLATLQIGNAAPAAVPEPGTWAAAALLVGTAGFIRWRKGAKVA